MMLNRGTLGGATLLKPETVALMSANHIGELDIYSDRPRGAVCPGQKFGLDFAVYVDPAAGQHPYGAGTYYWGGAAGTWFWIDPKNDLIFIGMIQSLGGRREGAMDARSASAALVYEALTARP